MECSDGAKTAGAESVLRDVWDRAASRITQGAGSDKELLKILNDRIITLAANESAVDQAVKDILGLARKREMCETKRAMSYRVLCIGCVSKQYRQVVEHRVKRRAGGAYAKCGHAVAVPNHRLCAGCAKTSREWTSKTYGERRAAWMCSIRGGAELRPDRIACVDCGERVKQISHLDKATKLAAKQTTRVGVV